MVPNGSIYWENYVTASYLKSSAHDLQKKQHHWGHMMQASLNKAIIGSNYGLPPVQRQAIIWTNAGYIYSQVRL